MLEDFCTKNTQQPVVYLDTDTFLYRDPADFLAALQENEPAFMHKRESMLREKGHTQHRMWEQINCRRFGGMFIEPDAYMWNAGVVALPSEAVLEAVQLVLKVCDDMCERGVTQKLIEQFSFSYVLSKVYDLRPCDNLIGHYWGNKEGWNSLVSDFLMKGFMASKSFDEMINDLYAFDFRQAPIYLRIPTLKKRLLKLLEKQFPNKRQLWIN